METLNLLTGQESNQLTLFAEDILASLLVPLANDTVQTTQDIYGPGSSKPLANYDPDTHLWRMYEGICLWDLPKYLQTLLPSGMTQSGVLYQQPVWEQIIGETESSLWPTPVSSSQMAEDISTVQARLMNKTPYKSRLVEAVAMWPTPTTVDAPTQPSRANPNLSDAAQMRPNLSELPPTTKEFRESKQIWPTPTFGKLAGGTGGYNMIQDLYLDQKISDEERRSMQAGNGGKLNPTWVEWLMGFPAGWTDLNA
jgi:hypothetical protein